MQYYEVKNLKKYQHYKNRNPPWIKLHQTIFTDYEFSCLQDASKLHLILIWLLASKLENRIPNDSAWLKQHLQVNSKVDLNPLIKGGWLIASKTLADCKQGATPETETETETETENPLGDEPKKSKEYSEDFETLWLEKPERDGANPKPKAFQSYNARINQGETTPEKALAQVIAYRKWCEHKCKVGTETVMQMTSFFGPKQRGFENDWSIKKDPPKKPSTFESKRSVADSWLERSLENDKAGVSPGPKNIPELRGTEPG